MERNGDDRAFRRAAEVLADILDIEADLVSLFRKIEDFCEVESDVRAHRAQMLMRGSQTGRDVLKRVRSALNAVTAIRESESDRFDQDGVALAQGLAAGRSKISGGIPHEFDGHFLRGLAIYTNLDRDVWGDRIVALLKDAERGATMAKAARDNPVIPQESRIWTDEQLERLCALAEAFFCDRDDIKEVHRILMTTSKKPTHRGRGE